MQKAIAEKNGKKKQYDSIIFFFKHLLTKLSSEPY